MPNTDFLHIAEKGIRELPFDYFRNLMDKILINGGSITPVEITKDEFDAAKETIQIIEQNK